MQVRCPRCTQEFQTPAAGVQSCPRCGQTLDVPEGGGFATAVGTAPDASLAPSRGPTPWERRRELGRLPAAWQTWKAVMFDPDRFFQSVRPDAPWVDAMLFGWMMSALNSVFQLLLGLSHIGPLGGMRLERAREVVRDYPALTSVVDALSNHQASFQVSSFVGGLLLFPLLFLIVGGLNHLLCMVFGAAKNGFPATLSALGYAQAPNVLVWVPCLGIVAALYGFALQIWGLYRVQETTPGRMAGMAGLALFLLCCCGCSGLLMMATVLAGSIH